MRLAARLLQLVVGQLLFGTGLWLGLQAGLGVGPWDVLHGGLSDLLGTPFGRTTIAVSALVLVVSVRAGARPGLGTVTNVLLVGGLLDVLLDRSWLDGLVDDPVVARLAVTVLGIATVAVGSALYLGAHFGAGPRDGLMVVLARRTGWSVGRARAVLELSVLVVGVLLGGPVGVGTVLFALGIGPAVQTALRLLHQTPDRPVVVGPRPAPEV